MATARRNAAVQAPVIAHSMRELTTLLRDHPLVEIQWSLRVYHGTVRDGFHLEQRVRSRKDIEKDDTLYVATRKKGPTKWALLKAFYSDAYLCTMRVKPGTKIARVSWPREDDAENPFLDPTMADGGVMWLSPGCYGSDKIKGSPNTVTDYGITLRMWNVDRLEIMSVETVRHIRRD